MSLLRQRVWRGLTSGTRMLTALDGARNRYSHLVVETRDRSAGFALFGGWQVRHLFERVYLGDPPACHTRVVFHQAATLAMCERLLARYGLVVFCGEAAPQTLRARLLTIPAWVEMERSTPQVFQGPGAVWSSSAKRDIRKIRQQRFQSEVLTGDGWLSEFYDRMFVPTLKRRHGASAHVASRGELAAIAQKEGAEFLRIVQDGKWIAGSLSLSTPNGYRFMRLGWLDGEPALLHDGVVGALYWFSLRRAAELGHSRVLFGGGYPFLDDGVMAYKSKWGAELSSRSEPAGEFHLLLDPLHPHCRLFMTAQSVVSRGDDREFIVFSGRQPEGTSVGLETMSSIRRWYRWREHPLSVPEITASEVPPSLRPWLTSCPLPDSPSRCPPS